MNQSSKILILLFLLYNTVIQAQSLETENKLRPYINLYHQHHDFFGEAFSFQGLEAGTHISAHLFGGLYASTFASNLQASVNNTMQYVWLGQCGILCGWLFTPQKKLHTGAQLNAGIFSMKTNGSDFGWSDINLLQNDLNGFTLSPQVFAGFTIAKWFELRAGLAYNFYLHNNQLYNCNDLNHLSFNFGFVFNLK